MSRPNETASRPSIYGSPPSAIFCPSNAFETAISDGLAGSSAVPAVNDCKGFATSLPSSPRMNGTILECSPPAALPSVAKETLYARRHLQPSHQARPPSLPESPSLQSTRSMLSISTAHLPASQKSSAQCTRPSYVRQSSSEEETASSPTSTSEVSTPMNAVSPSTFAFSPSARTGTTLSHGGTTSGPTTGTNFTPMTTANLPAHTAKLSKGVFRHFQLEKLSEEGTSLRPRLLRSVSENTYTTTIPSRFGGYSAHDPPLAYRSYSAFPSPNTSGRRASIIPGFVAKDCEVTAVPLVTEGLAPALAIQPAVHDRDGPSPFDSDRIRSKIASCNSSLSTDTTASCLSDLEWSSAAPSTSTQSYSPLESAARLKLPSNFDADTREAIRRAAASILSNSSRSGTGYGGIGQSAERMEGSSPVAHATSNLSVLSSQAGLMGDCGNGYFGKRIRETVQAIALDLISECVPAMKEEQVSIAEYGASNSLSSFLITPIASHIDRQRYRHGDTSTPYFNVTHADLPGFDFRPLMLKQSHSLSSNDVSAHQIFTNYMARPFAVQIVPPRTLSLGYSLMDLHWRHAPAQTAAAAAHNDLQAFLEVRAKEFKQDGLLIVAYIQRRDTQDALPQHYKRVGRNGQILGDVEEDLRTPYFPSPIHTPPATISRARPASIEHSPPDLLETSITAALSTTSSVPLARTRSGSSPCPPSSSRRRQSAAQTDIWTSLPALLAPCIQRLVSTGLIKSDTARRLLSLPLYPRTPLETKAVLKNVQHLWKVEHSYGLGDAKASNPLPSRVEDATSRPDQVGEQVICSPLTPTPASIAATSAALDERFLDSLIASNLEMSGQAEERGTAEDALVLSHPAYTAFQAGTLSRIQFAEHALQFIRVLYEALFRTVLKEHARLSRGKLEEVLDALNEVLREKIEEPDRAPLPLELECCIYALKRL